MASGSVNVMEDEELKGDGKKRKFKPLEAVRKLFGKGRRRGKEEPVSVVAVKAKSTTALNEDDDDAGFKNRQPRPLGGTLSISQDSIFSPDQLREPNLQALKKAAVSEESLPKTAFQAELFSKLTKRRSQYSDEDDGLPHSPTPPVTTADIIMGGPLKPLPAAGKSTSRESDNSLISNDASDSEEEDPFQAQWKSSVPSKVSTKSGKTGGAEAPLDFENLGQTELLKSDIAKDRISIKRRSLKTNRQSRKKREGQSPHSLPSLNEESPPKSRSERTSTSSIPEAVDSAVFSGAPSSPVVEKPRIQTTPPPSHPSLVRTTSAEHSPSTHQPVSTAITTTSLTTPQPEKKEDTAKDDNNQASFKSDPKSPSWKEAEKDGIRSSPIPKEDSKGSSSVRVEVQPSITVREDEKRGSLKSEPKSPTIKTSDFLKSSDPKSPTIKTSVDFVKLSDPKSPTIKTSVDFVKSSDPKSPTIKTSVDFVKSSDPKSPTIKTSVDFVKAQMESESRSKVLSSSRTMESLKKENDSDSISTTIREQGSSGLSRSMIVIGSARNSVVSESSSTGAKPKVELLSSSTKPIAETSSSPQHSDPKPGQVSGSVVKPSSVSDHTSSPVMSEPSVSPGESRKEGLRQIASPGESRKEGLRQTDSQTSPAFSPKDDYKLRRQSRSKTLPEQSTPSKEEPFAVRVQRAASHRAEPTTSQNASPDASPRHRQKAGALEMATSKPSEPEWFALARRKTGRQESEDKDPPSPTGEAAQVKDPALTVQGAVTSATPSPKEEPAPKAVETTINVSVSAASARFGDSSKPSEVSRFRGGSVKTSPTKTSIFANRGSSVKAQPAKVELGAASSSLINTAKTSTVSSTKLDETKEEAKSSESLLKEVPKWKAQSVKTPSVFSSSASSTSSSSSPVSTSRFSGMKPLTQTSTTPLSSSAASVKTESKPMSSPAKAALLTKAPSEEKDKDKPTVPAWRAGLSQKKPVTSDIKIELIETTSSKPVSTMSSAAGGSKEESVKKDELAKKEEPKVAATGKDVQPDQCRSSAAPARTSKVMNLMKNFENVQGVS